MSRPVGWGSSEPRAPERAPSPGSEGEVAALNDLSMALVLLHGAKELALRVVADEGAATPLRIAAGEYVLTLGEAVARLRTSSVAQPHRRV